MISDHKHNIKNKQIYEQCFNLKEFNCQESERLIVTFFITFFFLNDAKSNE